MNRVIITATFVTVLVKNVSNLLNCSEKSNFSLNNKNIFIESKTDSDYNIHSIFTFTESVESDKSFEQRKISLEGLQRVFAVKYAVNSMNKRRDILPNITLGYIFNDACFNLSVTMSHGIELVDTYRRHRCISNTSDFNNSKNTCARLENKVVAAIGDYYSSSTIKLASLLNIHKIPLITDGASSPLLNSSNSNFKSFFRTIQSDAVQVDVMIEVLKLFNWSYIIVIGSDDNYGKVAVSILKQRAAQESLCIVEDIYIATTPTQIESNGQGVMNKIIGAKRAQVVVMFTSQKKIGEHLLQLAYKMNISRIWLTNDAWNPDILSSSVPITQIESLLTISLYYGDDIPELKEYINDVVNNDYECDFLLKNFISETFNCTVHNKSENGKSLIGFLANKYEKCEVPIDQLIRYITTKDLNQVNYLVDAVNAIGYALHAAACNQTICRLDVQPQEVTKTLKTLHAPSVLGGFVEFNSWHSPTFSRYSIDQVQLSAEKAKYVRVGTWDTKSKLLNINATMLKWPSWLDFKIPTSSCRNICNPGEKVVGKNLCCWHCVKCSVGEISNVSNADSCSPCPEHFFTKDHISCIKMPTSYIASSNAVGIFSITLSIIGICLTIVSYLLFLFLRKKSVLFMRNSILYTTLSDFLPLSTFCYTFLELTYPSETVCIAQDIYFNLLCIFYASILIIKNKSVGHFLPKLLHCLGRDKILRMGLIFFLVSMEIIFLTIWINARETFVSERIYDNILYIRCMNVDKFSRNSTIRLTARIFPAVSLLIGAILTLPERNSNYNFGELRSLFFFGVTLVTITGAYGITINQVLEIFQPWVVLIATNGYGFTYLLCLTLPKFYITFKGK
ncbi:extracellular calcium-sensing receptor [Hydra vulgaris]|uniref:Extracellular calcium-sensing receptor n=1 Tax=Hydra vulgaris TaxID=6087 RepID=A0ABM4D0C0_HYDVU